MTTVNWHLLVSAGQAVLVEREPLFRGLLERDLGLRSLRGPFLLWIRQTVLWYLLFALGRTFEHEP